MDMGNFLAELKRRHVYRAGAAYAVAAFGLIEIVSNVAPMFDLPGWIGRAVVLVLIIGFPLTMFVAWMIEAKPKGAQGAPTSKLDFVLAGALVLVVGLLIYQQIAPAPQGTGSSVVSADGVSIAVLPFVNLSGDPAQEFFSDGMTEEITSALAKVTGLRVVGRTSAFEFKGQNKDLRAIGQALGAANLLEGSVRKSGNRIRITGQLIRANDGTHIWTENYDRELTDIFATQDEIGRSIAAALQVPLGLKAGETLVTSRAIAPNSYQQYLAAKAIVRNRGEVGDAGKDLMAAISLLEAVVAREPAFAPALALLSYTYALAPGPNGLLRPRVPDDSRATIQGYLDKAQDAASKAVQLDPKLVGGYLALAYVQAERGRWAAAEDLFKQAAALDPNDPDVMHEYSVLLAYAGKLQAALKIRERLLASDPLVRSYRLLTGSLLRAAGRTSEATRMLEGIPPERERNNQLAATYAEVGRFSEAADLLLAFASPERPEQEQAARLLRAAPNRASELPLQPLNAARFAYFYVGAPERMLDYPERAVEVGYMLTATTIWGAEYAGLRRSPRYKALMRKAGLVDYWRERGWPDVCRPVGADDFECS